MEKGVVWSWVTLPYSLPVHVDHRDAYSRCPSLSTLAAVDALVNNYFLCSLRGVVTRPKSANSRADTARRIPETVIAAVNAARLLGSLLEGPRALLVDLTMLDCRQAGQSGCVADHSRLVVEGIERYDLGSVRTEESPVYYYSVVAVRSLVSGYSGRVMETREAHAASLAVDSLEGYAHIDLDSERRLSGLRCARRLSPN